MKFEWENLYAEENSNWDNIYSETCRAKVIGGWLIKEIVFLDKNPSINKMEWDKPAISITFIPDPNNEWTID